MLVALELGAESNGADLFVLEAVDLEAPELEAESEGAGMFVLEAAELAD